jgi:hypothetical protein
VILRDDDRGDDQGAGQDWGCIREVKVGDCKIGNPDPDPDPYPDQRQGDLLH